MHKRTEQEGNVTGKEKQGINEPTKKLTQQTQRLVEEEKRKASTN